MWCENSIVRAAAAASAAIRLFLCDTEIKIDSDYTYAFMYDGPHIYRCSYCIQKQNGPFSSSRAVAHFLEGRHLYTLGHATLNV